MNKTSTCTKDRVRKPLYFFRRWKDAIGSKKEYYALRLRQMNVNVDQGHEVIAAWDDTCIIAVPILDIAVHIRELNWKTGEYLN